MTEEETARHEESEGRRQQVEHGLAMRETEEGINVTPEEIKTAQEKAGEREETHPWGQ
ncbi:MAG: hypothetical protein AAB789_01140 [Patescibacteria group bacterium]